MIGIISDIHGNITALKAVISQLDLYGCETIISAGDVAGYYCKINECIELLRSKNVVNIMGNHDYYLISNTTCPRSKSANLCLDYQREIIEKDNLEWLKLSHSFYDTNFFSVRHGGWNNNLDEYIVDFNFDDVKKYSQKLFISGHTHVQKKQSQNGILYFNPGSVGQPRDNDNRAAFALIDDNMNIIMRRASYDIDETANYMKESGFGSWISDCLYKGVKIGDN